MTRRFGFVLLVVLGALAASGVPASAHAPADTAGTTTVIAVPSTLTWQASALPVGVHWIAIVAAIVAVVAGARRPPRALALAAVLLLAFLAFENGVHSVHHLSDRTTTTTCAVASAATHVAGTPTDATSAVTVIVPLPERLVVDHQPSVVARSLGAHQGRAPPPSV